ncbi:MAG: DNA polymerase Y family protein [Wenzhouxiangellaceae bacterium]|nr:DNA polymerase Y family protein [Wenzhouxiangellaceae bacterium]
MSTLWAGLFCPQLALQARLHAAPIEPHTPLAVHEVLGGCTRIIEANRAAHALGIQPGQKLADALAIAPRLQVRTRCRTTERQLIDRVALAAYHYSHQVAPGDDGMVLEIGASRRLHGNADALLARLLADLDQAGIVVRSGSAPHPAAACLLARHGRHVGDRAALDALLQHWPLDRLGLANREYQRLAGLGIKQLGQFLDLPRFERTRRLGSALNQHIDRLCGRVPTPLNYWRPPEQFRQRLELPCPSDRHEALLFALNRLLDALGHWLRVRDRALAALAVELHPEDRGRAIELEAGLHRPGFDRERLLDILRLKLEPVRLVSPIEALVMRAARTSEACPGQADLWGEHNAGDAWSALLDRLGARIGRERLCGIAPCADHRPEKAWRWTAPGTTATVNGRPDTPEPERPGWLLPEPKPCRINDLRLLDGPERIESGWWDGQDCRRDYWSAHDRHGNRLWVFREYKPHRGWFVHGLFD